MRAETVLRFQPASLFSEIQEKHDLLSRFGILSLYLQLIFN